MGRPLKIAKAQAVLTITGTDATTEEVTVSQTLADYGIIAGMPFIPASTTGGLTGGTTYWILAVTGASTFTVSATQLSANPTYTKVNLSATSGTTVAATVGAVDNYFNNPVSGAGYPATNTSTYSVVGGNTAIYGKQVLARVAISVSGTGTITATDDSAEINGVGTDFANTLSDGSAVATSDGVLLGYITDIANANATFATLDANSLSNASGVSYVYADNEAGFIVRQKGKTKYLVQGATSGLLGACWTANVANAALAPAQMSILSTNAASGTAYVQSLSDHTVEVFGTGNALPNATPAYATFNTAYAANTYGGQPYPIVTIANA